MAVLSPSSLRYHLSTCHAKNLIFYRKRNFSVRSSSKPSPKPVVWKKGALKSQDGVNLVYHFTDVQDPLPLFVFLHGFTSSGQVLIPLLSKLSHQFQIFVPSARGHGYSQGSPNLPPGSFTMENLVSDAKSALEHFQPTGTTFLGGHSMGAATAARLAKKHPGSFRGVVLEDPPWLRLPGEPILPSDSAPRPFDRSRQLKLMKDEEFRKLLEEPEEVVSTWQISQLESERLFDADGIEPIFRSTDDDINEAVTGIQVPALLQTAGGPGGVCSDDVARRVMATWRDGRRDIFPIANHVIHDPPHSHEWLESSRKFLLSLL